MRADGEGYIYHKLQKLDTDTIHRMTLKTWREVGGWGEDAKRFILMFLIITLGVHENFSFFISIFIPSPSRVG